MNRITIIIAVALFIVALGVVFSVFYFSVQNDPTPGVPEERGFFETVFPFGGTTDERRPTITDDNEEEETVTTSQEAPLLRLVTAKPVSGAVVIARNSDDKEVIRYVDRETGHFFETETATLNKAPLSNTTIPRVQEAIWSPDGTRVLLRFINENDEIETFSAEVPENPSEPVDGAFLDTNIPYITTFDDEIGYTILEESGTSFIRANYEGRAARKVFFTPLGEVAVDWISPSRIVYGSKPSRLTTNSVFYMNTANQNDLFIGEEVGTSFLGQPEGSSVLLSFANPNSIWMTLGVYDLAQGDFIQLFAAQTLAEKCVWGVEEEAVLYCASPTVVPQGIYPDDWYKGVASFDDEIWKVDTSTLESERIINLAVEAQEPIDAFNLRVSPSGDYLIFMNKKDLSLWSLRLTEEEGVEDN